MNKLFAVSIGMAGLLTTTLFAEPSLNQFTGTISSIDTDAGVIRLSIDGGYNVELTFDSRTAVTDSGHAIQATDLSYGDKVTARYAGQELYAKQIARNPDISNPAVAQATVSSGTTPPAVSSSSSSSTATP